jgi:hypothetical protein
MYVTVTIMAFMLGERDNRPGGCHRLPTFLLMSEV